MAVNVAVIGATGMVGREVLDILSERLFPIADIHVLASRQSLGSKVSFGDRTLTCADIEQFDFTRVDVVFMAAGADVARLWAPKIAAQGVLVIDNSSAFRMDDGVPLIVPEVNPDAIELARAGHLIANPNCSTIQMVVALKPLHDEAIINRIVACTYQSVSGAGKDAMDELWTQTRGLFVNDEPKVEQFTKQIAFNLIPHIDDFLDDGSTKEETKMVKETHKIMDPAIAVSATCVRVPVFVGHAVAVNVTFDQPLTAHEARVILREAPGVVVIDKREDAGYATPLDVVGEFGVYVSRLRKDASVENALNMWIVADNLRKGAALNAVQIAELAVERGLV